MSNANDAEPGDSGPQESNTPTDIGELVRLRGVSKTYHRGEESVKVLDGVELRVRAGAFEALMGPSGSGKTTLLNLIAGLDRPSQGTIEVAGQRVETMKQGALAKWRARTLGFVFQNYNLLPVLTARENVELPLLLTRLSSKERLKRAETALRVVGLSDRMGHYPRQLSGGQEQRVAIARAIVNDPQLVIADEPTGDLDRTSSDEILKLLERLCSELGKTVIMVTHDPAAAERASVVHRLDKGALE
jgi:putative ABC transport system ATP-binding protein